MSTHAAHKHVRKLVSGDGHGSDEIAELGREAIKGVTTVGTVAIAGSVMGGIVGSMQK
jgi:hypothetical protein